MNFTDSVNLIYRRTDSVTMKERMRELGIKMTEMAEYLKISRPTLYRYIDLYGSGGEAELPANVLNLFRFMETPGISKEQVISFMIGEFGDTSESETKDSIRRYVSSKPDSDPKVRLISAIVDSDCMDAIVPYLTNSIEIMSRGAQDESEVYQAARLALLRDSVQKNMPLTPEEMERAKRILGD